MSDSLTPSPPVAEKSTAVAESEGSTEQPLKTPETVDSGPDLAGGSELTSHPDLAGGPELTSRSELEGGPDLASHRELAGSPQTKSSPGQYFKGPRQETNKSELRPIPGPSALGGDPKRFWSLTWTLAVLDFRLKFFGSVLGYVWQLMKPLMLFGVLCFVFTQVMNFGENVKYYPAFLLMGVVIFTFFSEAVSASVGSVMGRENIVRKIHFPRMVIPLSVVLTSYLNFLLNFAAVFFFVLIQGVTIRLEWLEVIPLIMLLGVFCTGLAMALSALYIRYRDVAPITDVALMVAFYATPILYTVEKLQRVDVGFISGETVQHIFMCNPLAAIIQQARHALIDPTSMSAAQAIGGPQYLLIPLAIMLGTCFVGYRIFNRSASSIAENL